MNVPFFFLAYLHSRMLTMKDNMGEQWLSKEQRSRQTGGASERQMWKRLGPTVQVILKTLHLDRNVAKLAVRTACKYIWEKKNNLWYDYWTQADIKSKNAEKRKHQCQGEHFSVTLWRYRAYYLFIFFHFYFGTLRTCQYSFRFVFPRTRMRSDMYNLQNIYKTDDFFKGPSSTCLRRLA